MDENNIDNEKLFAIKLADNEKKKLEINVLQKFPIIFVVVLQAKMIYLMKKI